MERFIPSSTENDEREYDRLRSDTEWNDIYSFIRHGYWHVTSIDGWSGIQKVGAIGPNVDGRYSKRFGDITDRSFGYINGFVSLFDFCDPTEEKIMRQWGNSWDVLVNTQEDQILIKFDRLKLITDIIPNARNFCPYRGQIEGGCIPWVEVWYPRAIPIAFIQSVYRLHSTQRFEFNPIPVNWSIEDVQSL